MSKYIKLEDALEQIRTVFYRDEYQEWLAIAVDNLINRTADLPTIEVSEDCISKKWLEDNAKVFGDYYENTVWAVPLSILENAPSVTTEQSSMVGEVHKPDYSYESELMKRTSDTNTNAPGSKSHMLRPPCEQCPDWGNCKDGCLYEKPKR